MGPGLGPSTGVGSFVLRIKLSSNPIPAVRRGSVAAWPGVRGLEPAGAARSRLEQVHQAAGEEGKEVQGRRCSQHPGLSRVGDGSGGEGREVKGRKMKGRKVKGRKVKGVGLAAAGGQLLDRLESPGWGVGAGGRGKGGRRL